MKLTGPAIWRKIVLFIDPLICLAVTCNLLVRGSALALSRWLRRPRFRPVASEVRSTAATARDEALINRYDVS
jgi:hypothetical protein